MIEPVLQHKADEVTFLQKNNELNIPVDGKIPLEKDKEAVKAYFLEDVNPRTMFFHSLEEKLDYLVENDYIEEKMIDMYEMKFIKKLFKSLYNKKFRFRSFMSAYKFYTQYALKTNDGKWFLERFEDRLAFNALFLAQGDEELAIGLAEEMICQRYQPATPTFLNAGKKRRGEFVSCFLVDTGDSMLDIGRVENSALQLSRLGGGVGINLSNLRGAGDTIKGIENASSGVVPVMKILEDSFSYSNQLGQRNGAGAVYLSVFHPDIVSFLSTKKENADEKVRVKTLSLGITVPDKFYELKKNNDNMYLFSPYDVEKHYGVPFSYVDITAEYENMVANPNIKKSKINPRELETEISKLQQESGYPYVINIDTANRANAVEGKIIMSNLCSEILQPQEPSRLNKDLSYDIMGTDISCNLGSTNVTNLIKSKDFGKSVEIAVRGLTAVTDESSIEEVPTVKNGNDKYHTIGLGAMGLHTAFAVNGIQYGSEESIEFTEAYFMALNYHSIKASAKIAGERNETFEGFEKSKYATGEYFDKYTQNEFSLTHPVVKKALKNMSIPTIEDWEWLRQYVAENGMYHRNRLAIAPTGSISYVNEASASLHPITQLVEERQEKSIGKAYYPAPYLSNKTMPFYKSAYDMSQKDVIDIYAVAQKHIDQGMSLTLFMRSELPEGLYDWKEGRTNKMTTRDLNMLRDYAWTKGVKSIYYVRTFTDDGDTIGSNQCESCTV